MQLVGDSNITIPYVSLNEFGSLLGGGASSLMRRKLPEEKALLAVEKRELELRAQKEYDRTHKPGAVCGNVVPRPETGSRQTRPHPHSPG